MIRTTSVCFVVHLSNLIAQVSACCCVKHKCLFLTHWWVCPGILSRFCKTDKNHETTTAMFQKQEIWRLQCFGIILFINGIDLQTSTFEFFCIFRYFFFCFHSQMWISGYKFSSFHRMFFVPFLFVPFLLLPF